MFSKMIIVVMAVKRRDVAPVITMGLTVYIHDNYCMSVHYALDECT